VPEDLGLTHLTYQAFSKPDTTQLLVLERGSDGDELRGTLREGLLSLRPEYIANSYTWGRPLASDSLLMFFSKDIGTSVFSLFTRTKA
jgi:hypothetical protein